MPCTKFNKNTMFRATCRLLKIIELFCMTDPFISISDSQKFKKTISHTEILKKATNN